MGGWVELISPVTPKDILYAGAGTDDPRDQRPDAGHHPLEEYLRLGYFRKLAPDVTLAAEWSFWDFRTRTFNGAARAARRLRPRQCSQHRAGLPVQRPER